MPCQKAETMKVAIVDFAPGRLPGLARRMKMDDFSHALVLTFQLASSSCPAAVSYIKVRAARTLSGSAQATRLGTHVARELNRTDVDVARGGVVVRSRVPAHAAHDERRLGEAPDGVVLGPRDEAGHLDEEQPSRLSSTSLSIDALVEPVPPEEPRLEDLRVAPRSGAGRGDGEIEDADGETLARGDETAAREDDWTDLGRRIRLLLAGEERALDVRVVVRVGERGTGEDRREEEAGAASARQFS